MCFPRQVSTARKLFTTICFLCFLRRVWCELSYPGKLPFSSLLCDEFRKTYFLRMPRQLSKYVSIRPNERFRKMLTSWRSRKYLAPTESPCCKFCDRLRRGYKLRLMSAIWRKKDPSAVRVFKNGKYWASLANNKALVEWLNKPCTCQGNVNNGRKSFVAEGFNVKIPFIGQPYTKAVAISFRESHTRTRKSC